MTSDHSAGSLPARAGSGALIVGVLVLITCLRLLLTGDHDILALNAPFDEFWFIHRAMNAIWGGPYDQKAFAQLPTYALWLFGLHLFGVAARLAIDLAWILASAYLAFALTALTRRPWIGAFVFVYLLFHPFTFVIFDRALAETLVAVASAAMVAAGIEIWNCRGLRAPLRRALAVVTLALALAVAYHSRKEGVVLLAPFGVLAVWSLADRTRWWTAPAWRSLGASLLIAPLLATLLFGLALAQMNRHTWGVYARYELAAPGYQQAMLALNAIDAGRTPAQVTVTAKARKLAYAVSPTFRELEPYFEGADGRALAAYTAQFTGVPGEIGNGWFYWAIREFAAQAGWHKSAPLAESKYAAIGREINQAFDSGRLTRRAFVFSPFIDPDIGKWGGALPRAMGRETALLVWPDSPTFVSPAEDALPQQAFEFAAIAGRRKPPPLWSVKGCAIVPAGSVIALGTDAQPLAWFKLSGPQRPDVAGAYPFSVSDYGPDGPWKLYAQTPDGRSGSVALASLAEGKMARLAGTADATIGVDQLTVNRSTFRMDRWAHRFLGVNEQGGWVAMLSTLYGVLGLLAGLAVVAACACAVWNRRPWPPEILVLTALAAGVAARVLVLAVVDVSSWSGAQSRYLLPAVPLFAAMAAVGAGSRCDLRIPRKVGPRTFGSSKIGAADHETRITRSQRRRPDDKVPHSRWRGIHRIHHCR